MPIHECASPLLMVVVSQSAAVQAAAFKLQEREWCACDWPIDALYSPGVDRGGARPKRRWWTLSCHKRASTFCFGGDEVE
jgi:hypothetical protein